MDPEHSADSAFSCNYSLGERLFTTCTGCWATRPLRRGLAGSILLRLADDPDDDCEGIYLDICHVAAAFKADASEETAEKVDQVIACWYDGDKAACPDTGPPDPLTPVLGPISGSIPHQPDDEYLEVTERFNQKGDVMIEVTFENPMALENPTGFTVSFLGARLMGVPTGSLSTAGRLGDMAITLLRKTSMVGEGLMMLPALTFPRAARTACASSSSKIPAGFTSTNRFIANINFTLGNLPAPDQMSLVIGDSGRGLNYKQGDVTRYRDFTIWKWHPSLFKLPKED